MTARKKATRKKSARRKKAARSRQSARSQRTGDLTAARVRTGGSGKPRVKLNLIQLRKLTRGGWSQREMADLFGIALSTFELCIKDDPRTAVVYREARANFKGRIRAAQLKSAETDRSPAMLKFLGVVELGQREPIGRGDGDETPEDELITVLTTKIMEFGARACREKARREREAAKEE